MSRNPPPEYVETNVDTYGIETRLDRVIELLEKIIELNEKGMESVKENKERNIAFENWVRDKFNPPTHWESNSQ